jgi:hypothetical protein
MKERPILFSAPMVRALLDGSKTQTRRLVKLPHENPLGEWAPTIIGGESGGRTAAGASIPAQGAIWHTRTGDCLACPYGQPGDRLWVRETHRAIWGQSPGYLIGVDYKADPQEKWERMRDHMGRPKWTPSIHMFREHSRILLEIVSVRVERLNDCSEADALAEGIDADELAERQDSYDIVCKGTGASGRATAQSMYRELWESINDAGSWTANPWVWVVDFRRLAADQTEAEQG